MRGGCGATGLGIALLLVIVLSCPARAEEPESPPPEGRPATSTSAMPSDARAPTESAPPVVPAMDELAPPVLPTPGDEAPADAGAPSTRELAPPRPLGERGDPPAAVVEAPPVEAASAEAVEPEPVKAEEEKPATPAAKIEEAKPEADFVSPQNIENQIEEVRKARDSILNLGLGEKILKLEEAIYERTRIRFAAAYTVVYQRASQGRGPLDAAGGDLDLLATWDAWGEEGRNAGKFNLAFEGRHKIGTLIAPSGLASTIDSLWTTVSGFNEQEFSIIQLYWSQELFRGKVRFIIGKLSPYSAFFGNRVNSSSTMLLNYAFADNPAVFMPGNGLGIHVRWDIAKRWTAVFGMQDANGRKAGIHPDTVQEGEFWYASQIQYRADIRRLGKGTYRLGQWYVNGRSKADQPPGAGVVFSLDQELGKQLIWFLRYEYQGSNLLTPDVEFSALTGTKNSLRVGGLIQGPLKPFPDDIFAFGFAWGTPADNSRARDSFVAEILYRSQLQETAQLSFSLQMIESSTIYDQVWVFGVRYRFTF